MRPVRCTATVLTMALTVVLVPAWSVVEAAVITVGPDGDWPTIQQAVDAAGSLAEGLIRVQAGSTFYENLDVVVENNGMIYISGGWDSTFSTKSKDPKLTVIDGAGNRVLDVVVGADSTFFLANLTIQNGGGVSYGGGVKIMADDSDDIGVYDNLFVGNSLVPDPSGYAFGGALYIHLSPAWIEVNGNHFIDNTIQALPAQSTPKLKGASVYADVTGGSILQMKDNLVQGSSCTTSTEDGWIRGCGLYIYSGSTSQLDVQGNTITDSKVNGFSEIKGVAGYIECQSSSPTIIERNRWQSGTVTNTSSPESYILSLVLGSDCVLTQRSSLIADSSDGGLKVDLPDLTSPVWRGVNLTISGNQDNGLYVNHSATATAQLSNSISFGNGEDLYLAGDSTVVQQYNLIGIDPGFANPVSGNYQLQEGSLALEAGSALPPGGLSTLDLKGVARVQGTVVDIGAYEGVGLVFKDGFESGDMTSWDVAVN